MIKSLRNKFISVLTLVACVMFAMLIGVNANFVKADQVDVDSNVFYMSQTASVRTDKAPAGIRFQVILGKDKFDELAKINEESSKESLDFVITVDKTGNVDDNEEKQVIHKVSADSFKNAKDEVIKLMFTITFDKVSSEKLIEAYAMNLTAECYVVNGAGTTVYAKGSGISQDMRSVASFNVLNGEENPALKGYYTSAKMVDGVAPYVAGTVGTRIYIDGLTTDYSNIYVNTTKVNATVNNGFVTIAKADMAKLLTTAPKNIIQAIDANGNVIAKEINDAVDTYAETVTFSAMDGDIDYSKILGNETVTGVEIVSSTAEQTSTVAFAENKLTGVDTIFSGYTDVQIKVMTEYSAKLVNLKVATKIIDEADDLQVFAIKQRDPVLEDGSDAIDGYFVLANDIDAKDVVINHRFADSSYNVYPSNSDAGFIGVLDGQGHAISNFTAQSCGLFGKIYPSSSGQNLGRGTVKNIAFINAKSAAQNASSSRYPSFFAHSLPWATFENVYIDYIFTTTNKGYNHIFSSNGTTRIILKNVVVEANFAEDFTEKYGVLYPDKNNGIQGYTISSSSINNYFITDAPVFVNETQIGVAGNVTVDDAYIAGLKIETTAKEIYSFEELKSYSSRAKMMADKEANADSLATFSDDYWMVFNGVPLWKGIDNFVAVADSDIVNVDTPANISLVDKKGNAVDGVKVTVSGEGAGYVIVEGMQIRVPATYVIGQEYDLTATLTATIDGVEVIKTVKLSVIPAIGKTIENVYIEADGTLVGLSDEDTALLVNATYSLDGNALTLADGKFNATAFENKTLGEYYDVSAISDGKINTLKVRYVTKTIDQASDLDVFSMKWVDANDKTLGSVPISGYYVLIKHIDAINYTATAHQFYKGNSYPDDSLKDMGFVGTLDGQGYSISNLTSQNAGFFGHVSGGVIKNIAFINAKVWHGKTGGYYHSLLAHRFSSSDRTRTGVFASLENVYITVSANVERAATTNVNILSNNNMIYCNITNTYLEVIDTPMTDGRFYSIVNNTSDSYSKDNAGTWDNYFVVANMPYVLRDKTKDITNIDEVSDIVGHTASAAITAGETTINAGDVISEEQAQAIVDAGIKSVKVKDQHIGVASNFTADVTTLKGLYSYKSYTKKTYTSDLKMYVDTKTMASVYTTEDSAKTAYKALTDTKLWEVQAYMDGETVVGYIPVWVGAQA